MKQRKTIDFLRALRAHCADHGLMFEEGEANGPSQRFTVYRKKGQAIERVCTLIIRSDKKEIDQGLARGIVLSLRKRVEAELNKSVNSEIAELVERIIKWLTNFFG